jgi:hypothetical protein
LPATGAEAPPPHAIATEAIAAALRANPDLAALLAGWSDIALPDAWLVAGCVAQSVWNARFALPPGHGIADIDLAYHDPHDLSAAAEAAHEARLRAAFPRLSARLDVKNQARVHCWYPAKFGRDIAPHASTPAAIATYPATATCLGIRPGANGLEICAPFGLTDLIAGIVRPNKALVSEAAYAAKTARWREAWPGLHIMPWA